MSSLGQHNKDTTPAINPSHCAVSVESEPNTLLPKLGQPLRWPYFVARFFKKWRTRCQKDTY